MAIPIPIPTLYRRLDGHMREILRGAALALALKGAGAVLSFAVYVALGRLLGAEGAGLYFQALTVAAILAVVGRAGLDNALLRFVAAGVAVGDWGSVKAVFRKAMVFALAVSAVLAAGLALSASWLAQTLFAEPKLAAPLFWMSCAVVPWALLVLHAQGLQGLGRVRDAVFVPSVALPFVTLVGALLLIPAWGVNGAVWAYVAACAGTWLAARWMWRRATPQLARLNGAFATSRLLASSVPLFWVATLQMVITWSSLLMLGVWAGSADVGVFGAASRTAMLTSFILVAVNAVAAPKFAALYQQGDFAALRAVAQNCARLLTVAALPVLALFLLAPGWVMGIFGSQFAGGADILRILALGEFVNIATGSAGLLLVMSGRERLLRNNLVLCASTCLILNLLLIPPMGAMGAAVAMALTVALQNVLAAAMVWSTLRIATVPLVRVGWGASQRRKEASA